MNWPAIGKYRVTAPRTLFAALVLLDATLALTGKDWTGLAFIPCNLGQCGSAARSADPADLESTEIASIVTYLFIFLVPMAPDACVLPGRRLGIYGAGRRVHGQFRHEASRGDDPGFPLAFLPGELAADRMAIVQQLTATWNPVI